MNVRTITAGLPLSKLGDIPDAEMRIGRLGAELQAAFADEQIAVRTRRVCMSPLASDGQTRINSQKILGSIKAVSEMCERLGIRWFNVPFDLTSATGSNLDTLGLTAFDVVRRFDRSFVNVLVARNGEICGEAIPRASKLIKSVAGLDQSGYHNFRVGVACNVNANTPFFPFSFSSDELGFSIGLEMPQALISIAQSSVGDDLATVRGRFVEYLVPRLQRIEEIARRIGDDCGMQYHGIDVSIAPYPEPNNSVAQLMELVCLDQFGSNGTMFATSFFTGMLKEVLRTSGIKSTGFNGVMLSLLEDDVMGQRNDRRLYGIDSLILYSTVCGCGVDMVPVPGDVFEEELSAIILDTAAASSTLNKPLGVRLLPIPHGQENDFTEFQMDFLFNTRIQKIRNVGVSSRALQVGSTRDDD